MMRNRGVKTPPGAHEGVPRRVRGSFTPRFPVSLSVTKKWAQNWPSSCPALIPSWCRGKIIFGAINWTGALTRGCGI